jgi:hypothetical protein
MTMELFYKQLVVAQRAPRSPLHALARLTRLGLTQARQLRSTLEWVPW